MPQLDEHARAQLEAYASTVQPSAERRRRNKALLLERLRSHDDPPEAAEAPADPAPVAVRWPLVALAAAALVALALGVASRDPAHAEPSTAASQADATLEEEAARPAAQRRSPPTEPGSRGTSAGATAQADPRSDGPDADTTPQPQPSPPSRVERLRPPAPPRRDAATSPNRLAAEVALITLARTHLAERKNASALSSFQRHAREFPNGALAEERSAWVAILQCRLGRDGGRQSAAAFLVAHPNSPHVRRVRKTCSTTVTDAPPTEE
ncbi:MAG: tetratricopeptide repeat protein [Nannocystales bacterium]